MPRRISCTADLEKEMDGIQAIKRENDLTAIRVRSNMTDLIDYGSEMSGVRGVIRTPTGETVLIVKHYPRDGGISEADAEQGLTAIQVSGDAMQGNDSQCAQILSLIHDKGVSESFVSVSETAMTLYLPKKDADRAWKIISGMI